MLMLIAADERRHDIALCCLHARCWCSIIDADADAIDFDSDYAMPLSFLAFRRIAAFWYLLMLFDIRHDVFDIIYAARFLMPCYFRCYARLFASSSVLRRWLLCSMLMPPLFRYDAAAISPLRHYFRDAAIIMILLMPCAVFLLMIFHAPLSLFRHIDVTLLTCPLLHCHSLIDCCHSFRLSIDYATLCFHTPLISQIMLILFSAESLRYYADLPSFRLRHFRFAMPLLIHFITLAPPDYDFRRHCLFAADIFFFFHYYVISLSLFHCHADWLFLSLRYAIFAMLISFIIAATLISSSDIFRHYAAFAGFSIFTLILLFSLLILAITRAIIAAFFADAVSLRRFRYFLPPGLFSFIADWFLRQFPLSRHCCRRQILRCFHCYYVLILILFSFRLIFRRHSMPGFLRSFFFDFIFFSPLSFSLIRCWCYYWYCWCWLPLIHFDTLMPSLIFLRCHCRCHDIIADICLAL